MHDKDTIQLDAEGKKHGIMETYHDNGNLYYKGLYIHGKMHGKTYFYSQRGFTMLIESYINGRLAGYYVDYIGYWHNHMTPIKRFYAR
jgi:antitoxin component YwqK of YwqJK toxin-antitoxin module